MDGREGAAPVDLGDDLPLLGLLVVASRGVEHHEVVGGHRPQREMIGGIGLRRPVIAVPRAVQQPLVLERGQLPADLDLAEELAVDHRQLERGALEVVHQDEGVVGIDPRVLGRRAEEIVGVRDHELIERRAGGHQDRGRRLRAAPRPAGLLPERGDRARIAGQHARRPGARCRPRARARWSRPRRAPRPTRSSRSTVRRAVRQVAAAIAAHDAGVAGGAIGHALLDGRQQHLGRQPALGEDDRRDLGAQQADGELGRLAEVRRTDAQLGIDDRRVVAQERLRHRSARRSRSISSTGRARAPGWPARPDWRSSPRP